MTAEPKGEIPEDVPLDVGAAEAMVVAEERRFSCEVTEKLAAYRAIREMRT